MKYGFIKVAAGAPRVRVADCISNADALIELAKEASDKGVKLLVFPELSISGTTCGDLFLSSPLQNGAIEALKKYVRETKNLDMVSIVGLPVKARDALYNCAAVCKGGEILRFIPKTALTNAESRYFSTIDGEAELLFLH